MEEVTLLGMWASSYSLRAVLALKLKGIPYKYVEEDLRNKSQKLLLDNPIHKKVPILVHHGRPIPESLIILEYIEETWKDSPLLSEDPYLRSRVRFWAHFYDHAFSPCSCRAVFGEGEEREKALKELQELINTLEEGIKRDFSGGTPFLHGEQPSSLDIVFDAGSCPYKAIEEAIGAPLIYPERNTTYFKWLCTLKDHPVVKESLPPHDKMVGYIKQTIEIILKSASV